MSYRPPSVGAIAPLAAIACGVIACGSGTTDAHAPAKPRFVTTSRAPAKAPSAGAASFRPFRPQFSPTGLVTNEWAYVHPESASRVRSSDWVVTSGSLFAQAGAGWTGVPDRVTPNSRSSNGTDSSVFRLVSRRHDFGNVAVTFDLFIQRHVVAADTSRHSYDGVHVWLRYASDAKLYALSVMRWDGQVVIKRKLPGGPSNGGAYRTLGSARHQMPLGQWVSVGASAVNVPGGVRLTIDIGGQQVLSCLDHSSHAITRAGALGLRGDNTEFAFRGFAAVPAS